MNKFTKLMEKEIVVFQFIEEHTGEPPLIVTVRWKHLITVLLLILLIGTCSGCGPARQANGEPFKATQVWRRITARDTTIPAVRIGGWAFPPGTVEYILWKRMDSLQTEITHLQKCLCLQTDSTKFNPNVHGN